MSVAENLKIDFVVPWVDGGDPAWRAERSRYSVDTMDNSDSENRYRDWDLMRYWFRGIEAFAPWVNRVYFVTCGHYPDWLNTEHPKLKLINHRDYIPEEYLPTFNSNVIELFMHRLPELSEHFVLFNDDIFLLRTVKQEDFFRDGKPCETAMLDAVTAPSPEDMFPHMVLNNMGIINRHFDKKTVIRRNIGGFFAPCYGSALIRNALLAPLKLFSAFRDPHLMSAYRKSTFEAVWEKEPEILKKTAESRFRSTENVTHWLMKCWQICEGNFVPRRKDWGHYFELGHDDSVYDAIRRQTYPAVCLNDIDPDLNFEEVKNALKECFTTILPNRSEFELYE